LYVFLRTAECHLEVNRPNPHLFIPLVSLTKTARPYFFENIVLLGSSDVGEAQTPVRKR